MDWRGIDKETREQGGRGDGEAEEAEEAEEAGEARGELTNNN